MTSRHRLAVQIVGSSSVLYGSEAYIDQTDSSNVFLPKTSKYAIKVLYFLTPFWLWFWTSGRHVLLLVPGLKGAHIRTRPNRRWRAELVTARLHIRAPPIRQRHLTRECAQRFTVDQERASIIASGPRPRSAGRLAFTAFLLLTYLLVTDVVINCSYFKCVEVRRLIADILE